MRIGNAAADELGGIAGAAPGDQTGREICLRQWFVCPLHSVHLSLDSPRR